MNSERTVKAQMVNINKLKGRIVEKGWNVAELAKRVGMDKATLYRKLSDNGESLLIKEVDSIIVVLEIPGEDVDSIFFSQFSE